MRTSITRLWIILGILLGNSYLYASGIQALVFDGQSNLTSDLHIFEASSQGGYEFIGNLPQTAVGDPEFKVRGEQQDLKRSMQLVPACQYYMSAMERDVIDHSLFPMELIQHVNRDPARSIIFMKGKWILEKNYSDFVTQNDTRLFPVAMRIAGKPYVMNSAEALRLEILKKKREALELLVTDTLLTVTSAQNLNTKLKTKLPWQDYTDMFSHKLSQSELAFEAGKGSSTDSSNFIDLLQAASFMILKEAIAFNASIDQVFLYVHSPDKAHHRLYMSWGFREVESARDNSDHMLLRISLNEMLKTERFNPSKFSQKMTLNRKFSQHALSPQASFTLSKTLKELMNIYLDFYLKNDESVIGKIRVDDRSMSFYENADLLLMSYGINLNDNSYKTALNKIKTLHYTPNNKISYTPEQIDKNDLDGNFFLQELSEASALKDPLYIAKVLIATAKWFQKRNAHLNTVNRSKN